MIDHSTCDHPSTSGARAKCRRLRNGGSAPKPRATPRAPQGEDDDRYGQTPSRREDECNKCGVERIAYSGTDPLTGILLYVGEKCFWYIKHSPDRKPIQP